jgi:signal transduction histidine kinase
VLRAELEVGLLENGSAEDLRVTVSSAIEETDRITGLAESLLVLASAEQGLLELNRSAIDPADLLAAIGARFRQPAKDLGRELTIASDGGSPVLGDRSRLEQALANLVENALRYGHGRIVLAEQQRGDQIELHVTDEGAGFPPAFLSVAFDRFSRADTSRPRGGAGLGLAIVRAIAHAHRGEVDAANRPDGGADVWITLAVADDRTELRS